MSAPADFRVSQGNGGVVIALTGDWTSIGMARANERLGKALSSAPKAALDLTGIEHCDTSGAHGVLRAIRVSGRPAPITATAQIDQLLEIVRAATPLPHAELRRSTTLLDRFERIGRGVSDLGRLLFDTMVFNGRLLVAMGRAVRHPAKVRWASVISLAERAGLDAIPIVGVTTFFIGAVVALLGANQLAQFGVQIYVVDLVGLAILREFNVLITTLLLAGRSASSFAAEIGAMKMNEEIDAMRVLGIDPFDALVIPRFLALLLTIPLLTFVATLTGLAGDLMITVTVLGLAPETFFQRLVDYVGVTNLWVGMSKAPVMAVVIAGIGCREGLAVVGDVESLGRRVTAAVVHAIFSAILIDAIFALIYMKLGL